MLIVPVPAVWSSTSNQITDNVSQNHSTQASCPPATQPTNSSGKHKRNNKLILPPKPFGQQGGDYIQLLSPQPKLQHQCVAWCVALVPNHTA